VNDRKKGSKEERDREIDRYTAEEYLCLGHHVDLRRKQLPVVVVDMHFLHCHHALRAVHDCFVYFAGRTLPDLPLHGVEAVRVLLCDKLLERSRDFLGWQGRRGYRNAW
jgi:hypothetical protein